MRALLTISALMALTAAQNAPESSIQGQWPASQALTYPISAYSRGLTFPREWSPPVAGTHAFDRRRRV